MRHPLHVCLQAGIAGLSSRIMYLQRQIVKSAIITVKPYIGYAAVWF